MEGDLNRLAELDARLSTQERTTTSRAKHNRKRVKRLLHRVVALEQHLAGMPADEFETFRFATTSSDLTDDDIERMSVAQRLEIVTATAARHAANVNRIIREANDWGETIEKRLAMVERDKSGVGYVELLADRVTWLEDALDRIAGVDWENHVLNGVPSVQDRLRALEGPVADYDAATLSGQAKKPPHPPHPPAPTPTYGGDDWDDFKELRASIKAVSKFTKILERDLDALIDRVERLEAAYSSSHDGLETRVLDTVCEPQAPPSTDLTGLSDEELIERMSGPLHADAPRSTQPSLTVDALWHTLMRVASPHREKQLHSWRLDVTKDDVAEALKRLRDDAQGSARAALGGAE